MRIQRLFSSLSFVLALAILISVLPAIAHASGVEPTAKKTDDAEKKETPTPQPRQDQSKKIYTNDDFGWFNPSASAAGASQSGQSVVVASQGSAAASRAEVTPLNPQQDPQWYAKQAASLNDELANVQSHVDALKQFRNTSTGLPTGLVLNAPTEGVSTDNRIAQLESRRDQILQQLDDLADLARVNGLPPGTLNQPIEQPSLTLAQQRDALTTQYRDISDQLADTQATLDNMQQQTAAQNMSLLPYVPGQGGNLTTNLLDNLNTQADALQNNLSETEDDALTLGVLPGDLR